MSLSVSSIGGAPALGLEKPGLAPAPQGKPGEFASLLEGAIQKVEGYRDSANQAVANMLTGRDEELHNVALATQQAELAFELGLQVRNKIVQAYQEVMRMQL